jgi:hypothetical protein
LDNLKVPEPELLQIELTIYIKFSNITTRKITIDFDRSGKDPEMYLELSNRNIWNFPSYLYRITLHNWNTLIHIPGILKLQGTKQNYRAIKTFKFRSIFEKQQPVLDQLKNVPIIVIS